LGKITTKEALLHLSHVLYYRGSNGGYRIEGKVWIFSETRKQSRWGKTV